MTTESMIVCGWTGRGFIPMARFEDQCAKQFVIGERYLLEVMHAQDWVGRKAYFGKVNQLFKNWPERLQRFDSPDHLRAWALIRTGHRAERQHATSSNTEALRFAALLRSETQYLEISVHESIVIVWEALSQRGQSMGAKQFAKSANDVIGFLCDLIGISEDELTAQYKATKISPALLPGPETRAVASAVPSEVSTASDMAEGRGALPSPLPGQDGQTTIIHDFSKGLKP